MEAQKIADLLTELAVVMRKVESDEVEVTITGTKKKFVVKATLTEIDL